MQVVTGIQELRHAIDAGPAAGAGPAFVPTMGALHAGHLSLMLRAASLGRPVVVSIFVNPTQFAPDEDFTRYPRPREDDLDACRRHGVDVVFAPETGTVYPPHEPVAVPPLPPVATEPGLEDACRPGHFAGVCQVVARLLDLVRPGVAVFGEKDFQQLRVIEAMVADVAGREPGRWPDLRIEPVPTVREPDGLALSSRNAYLDPGRRDAALGLHRALQAACAANRPATAEAVMTETLAAHGLEIDYAAVRDAATLTPVESFRRPTRGLIAARLGRVRLIDNRALPVWD